MQQSTTITKYTAKTRRFPITIGMKKYASILIALSFVLIITAPTVLAAPIDSAQNTLINIANKAGITNLSKANPEQNVAQFVGGIINALLGILGIAFMALTIYGGWLWMTAAGNQERVSRAKDLLRDSVIGIIVVVASYAITFFVIQAVTDSLFQTT